MGKWSLQSDLQLVSGYVRNAKQGHPEVSVSALLSLSGCFSPPDGVLSIFQESPNQWQIIGLSGCPMGGTRVCVNSRSLENPAHSSLSHVIKGRESREEVACFPQSAHSDTVEITGGLCYSQDFHKYEGLLKPQVFFKIQVIFAFCSIIYLLCFDIE